VKKLPPISEVRAAIAANKRLYSEYRKDATQRRWDALAKEEGMVDTQSPAQGMDVARALIYYGATLCYTDDAEWQGEGKYKSIDDRYFGNEWETAYLLIYELDTLLGREL
jgi:hypothetical protein